MLALIQFTRMGQAVRAGQRDADSPSTVQGGFDRARQNLAPAGLDRTPVGRIIRKTFRRSLREKTCYLAAMQARYRSTEKRIFHEAAFCGGKCIHAFSIPERDAMCRHPVRRGIEYRGPEK
ncbi:hypothetical protein [Burkholderia stabilis]